MEGEEGVQQPQLVLANNLFLLTQNDVDDIEKVRLRDEVFNFIVANGNWTIFSANNSLIRCCYYCAALHCTGFVLVDMAPLYETLVASKVLDLDQKALDSMRSKIDDELKKLEEK